MRKERHKTMNRREWILFLGIFLVWCFVCSWSSGAFSSNVYQMRNSDSNQNSSNTTHSTILQTGEGANPGLLSQDLQFRHENTMQKDTASYDGDSSKKTKKKSSFFKGIFKETDEKKRDAPLNNTSGDQNEGRHQNTIIAKEKDKTNGRSYDRFYDRLPYVSHEDVDDNQFQSCGYCRVEGNINKDIKRFSSHKLLPTEGGSKEEVLELDQKGRVLLEEILKKSPQRLDEEILSFTNAQNLSLKKSNIGHLGGQPVGKPSGRPGGQPDGHYERLYIFISLSLHKNTLRALLEEAKRVGGVLVLRGLKDGSWKKTIELMLPILKEYEEGIILDPTLFKRFRVREVPTIVLADVSTNVSPEISSPGHIDQTEVAASNSFDKIAGNISIDYALRLFKEKGDQWAAADRFLKGAHS